MRPTMFQQQSLYRGDKNKWSALREGSKEQYVESNLFRLVSFNNICCATQCTTSLAQQVLLTMIKDK